MRYVIVFVQPPLFLCTVLRVVYCGNSAVVVYLPVTLEHIVCATALLYVYIYGAQCTNGVAVRTRDSSCPLPITPPPPNHGGGTPFSSRYLADGASSGNTVGVHPTAVRISSSPNGQDGGRFSQPVAGGGGGGGGGLVFIKSFKTGSTTLATYIAQACTD